MFFIGFIGRKHRTWAEETRRGLPGGRLAIGLDWSALADAAFGSKVPRMMS